MNADEISPSTETEFKSSRPQSLTAPTRYWLRRPRGLFAIAALLAVGGAILNWNWLVAVGAAPILVALPPCAAMCALGVCMRHNGDASCSNDGKGVEPKSRSRNDRDL